MKKISEKAYFFKKTADYFMIGLFIVLLLFIWTLYKGPVSVPYLKPYIIQALNYDENEYEVSLKSVNLEFVRSFQPLRITAEDISLKKKDESFSVQAPKLYMSFSLRALLKGIIAPSDISIENPSVYVFADYGLEKGYAGDDLNKRKLTFYIKKLKEFLNNYNSVDKIYPESYVNNISVKGGEVEVHEVNLGRKWLLSDLSFEFNRNFVNLELNANTLVNINDKLSSVGFESEYHAATDKLDVELYFSDLILSDILTSFDSSTEESPFSSLSIEVPVNGRVNTALELSDILKNPEQAEEYLSSAVKNIDFELDGGHGYIAFDGEEKYNYEIDEVMLLGKITGGMDEINITDADFKMGGQTAKINFQATGLQDYYLHRSPENMKVVFNARINEFPLDDLSRFWPRYLAEPAWQWCKDGLKGGMAKNADFTFEFSQDKDLDIWGLQNLSGTAELEDGDLFYLEGMPPVHNVYGTAKFSPRDISIKVDKGVTDNVIITGGDVRIYDLDKEDNFISISLIGNSSITAALNLINNPPLNITAEMGVNPEKIQGNVDVKLNLDFELRQDLDAKDIKVNVDADLHDIVISELIPAHEVSAKNLQLKVTSSGWNLLGEAFYDDIPVKLTVDEKFAEKKYKSRCALSFKLDDAAKKTLGFDWSILKEPYIKGYAVVDADVGVLENGDIDVRLKADLQNASINYAFLGFVKEMSQKASAEAKLIIKKDKIAEVNSVSLSKTGFSIDGKVSMYDSGRVKSVDITKIKGPKTQARAKISLTDAAKPQIKADISGSSYDLTPLFDRKTTDSTAKKQNAPKENDDDGLEKTDNTDIFISVNSLWTNETTPIKNFAGNIKLRSGIGINEMHMVGNYGIDKSIKFKLDYIPKDNKEHYLSVDSNNAGSTLKVLRLYDNMVGGTLKIEARRLADKKFIGHLAVRDFSIQNAPVVAKLLSVASFTGMLDLLKGDGLIFTHFNAPFEYQYKVLTLKQAKAEGNVVGITTNGTYDRAGDNIKMYGVIAPAYSINRFLGKIPLVGNLLASKDGTIFAANYKIDGNAANPQIDISSLSMLSPNSLKEWYNKNFGDGNGL